MGRNFIFIFIVMPISQFHLFLYLTVNSGRKFVKQCFLIKLQCESACASPLRVVVLTDAVDTASQQLASISIFSGPWQAHHVPLFIYSQLHPTFQYAGARIRTKWPTRQLHRPNRHHQ